jgi:hypothetical protein
VRRLDGSGRLWEDCWADERIGYMPPSSVAMVIVFCRNHNVRFRFPLPFCYPLLRSLVYHHSPLIGYLYPSLSGYPFLLLPFLR